MRFFEPQMDVHVRERNRLERELRAAIEAGEILTFYQPLVDLKSGRIRAFEALARWTHPQLGEIDPERFISIAEDTGQIARLTDVLLRKACSEAIAWPPEIVLTLKLSPVLMRDSGLALRIMEVSSPRGLLPRGLNWKLPRAPWCTI